MIPRSILKNIVVKGFPRRCGGDPWMFKLEVTSHDVFPAGAGVILDRVVIDPSAASFPRRCGGDPINFSQVLQEALFSPQVRG